MPIEFKNAFTRELLENTYDNANVYKKNHIAAELEENENRQIEIPVADDYGEVKEIESKEQPKVVEEKEEVEDLRQASLDELFAGE